MLIKESLLLVVLVTLCYLAGRAHSRSEIPKHMKCTEIQLASNRFAYASKKFDEALKIDSMAVVKKHSRSACKDDGQKPSFGIEGNSIFVNHGCRAKFHVCYTTAPTAVTTQAGPVTMVRRVDGKVNFHETWAAYEKGFGNCQTGDCWLGLKALHNLCIENCKLQVTMTYNGKSYHATYTKFRIGPMCDNYRMEVGGYSGNAGDSMSINNDGLFSTKDRENDTWKQHCSQVFTGGWWYKACHHAHPTGTWDSKELGKGINWKTITTHDDSLSSITMKVTPTKTYPPPS